MVEINTWFVETGPDEIYLACSIDGELSLLARSDAVRLRDALDAFIASQPSDTTPDANARPGAFGAVLEPIDKSTS